MSAQHAQQVYNVAMTKTTPVEHDTLLLQLLNALYIAEHMLVNALSTLRFQTQPKGVYGRHDHRTRREILAAHEALRSDPNRNSWDVRPQDEAWARYVEAQSTYDVAVEKVNENHDGYTGWNRYFLVTSSDGLIHRSMQCSTCNKGKSATQFALLPGLSDTSVESAVLALGPALCSVCFHDAPVSYLEQERIPGKVAQVLLDSGEDAFKAALAAHKAKAAANAAAKCPGSGRYIPGVDMRMYRKYGKCPECGQTVSVTATAKARSHKAS